MIAATDWQSYGVPIGLLVVTAALMLHLRKRARQGGRPPAGGPTRLSPTANEKPLRRSMEQLLVELEALSREMNAQLDTKMRALTQLTDQAAREIERLERLLEEARGGAQSPSGVGTPSPPRGDPSGTRRPEGQGLTPSAQFVPAGLPEGERGSATGAPQSPPPLLPRHRRVHELADAGLTPVEIARETGQPVGEVELILSLRSAGPPDTGGKRPDQTPSGRLDLRT